MEASVSTNVPKRSSALPALGCGGISGLMLFASDYPLHLWPLMAVAFLPLLVVLVRFQPGWAGTVFAGIGLALGYVVPLIFQLDFPVLLSVFFAAYYTVFWVLFALLARMIWRRPGGFAALATGALAGLVDWATYSLVPIWGTGQSMGKVLADCPWGVGFVSFTGLSGILAVLVALQALLVLVIFSKRHRMPSLALLAVVLAVVLGTNVWVASPAPVGSVRVAALTFLQPESDEGEPLPAMQNMDTHIRPMVADAAKRGARVVATPEFSLRAGAEDRDEVINALSELARLHDIWLFAGFFDKVDDKNRILFINPRGDIEAVYEKVHLIYQLEFYNPGDGTLARVDVDGVTWGGVICQDDNFGDITSAYARAGVQLMVVPTYDWAEVKDYHFESSRFRSVEYRYGILRSAMDGISAIVAPGGRVVASHDVFKDGEGVLVGDLPVPGMEHVRARWHRWFPLLCGLILLAGLFLGRRWGTRRGTGGLT